MKVVIQRSPLRASAGNEVSGFLKLPVIDDWCDPFLIQAVMYHTNPENGVVELWVCSATAEGEVYALYSHECESREQAEAYSQAIGVLVSDACPDGGLQNIPHFDCWINPQLIQATKAETNADGNHTLALLTHIPGHSIPTTVYTLVFTDREDLNNAREEVGRFLAFSIENPEVMQQRPIIYGAEEDFLDDYNPELPDHQQARSTIH